MAYYFACPSCDAQAKPASPKISADNVQHPDAFAREVIARCWNQGGIVIANRDDSPPNA